MKKFSLIAIFFATIVNISINCDNTTVGKNVFNWLYQPSIGEPIRNTINFENRGWNLIFGFFTGIAGFGLFSMSIRHLIAESKIFLELWKKYENGESIKIEWRKFPRRAIMTILAIFGIQYSFSVACAGFDRARFNMYTPDNRHL